MYADVWLGFSLVELIDLLRDAGFQAVHASVVHREEEAPHFETMLAIGEKPGVTFRRGACRAARSAPRV